MQVIYGNHPIQLVPLNGAVAIDADVTLSKSILYGTSAGGSIVPVEVNGGGFAFSESDKTLRVDNTIATTLYLGEAVIGSSDSNAVWKIKRIDISGTLISIKYASNTYDQIWNSRASLTYV
jgi:hypothetical protein